MFKPIFLILMLALPAPVWAGEADVINVEINKEGPGIYQLSATVQHADAGWDHYADRWEVLNAEGKVLATRVLLHPHVSEQPFTRSLSGVRIPNGTSKIIVRAHDSVHGFGGKTFPITHDRF